MSQPGEMNSMATHRLGPAPVRRTPIRWKALFFLGNVLTLDGAMAAVYEVDGELGAYLVLSCTKADGTVATQGWMTFVGG